MSTDIVEFRSLLSQLTGLPITASVAEQRREVARLKQFWIRVSSLPDKWDKIPYGRGSTFACARDLRRALGQDSGSTTP
jgi:hypothetical protein